MTLDALGWNSRHAREWEKYETTDWQPARLIRDNKITYGALLADGCELEVVMGGKVYHDAQTDADLPAVGDWVAVEVGGENEEHVIRARLPRQTCLSRKASGRSTEEQVIAANVDAVVVVTDAEADLNLRRLERYFAIIGRSGAEAIVLINKMDLFSEEQKKEAVAAVCNLNPSASVHLTSITDTSSLDILKNHLEHGRTLAFIGSSGVGKSTLINHFLGGDYQWTSEVNATTGKGRHTTTARELMVLRSGGILIDNPGIREVHMWTDEVTLREHFADLEELAATCKFNDCRHEPKSAGCAIRAAIQNDVLSEKRLAAFLKLDEEIASLRAKRKKRQLTISRRTRRDADSKTRREHKQHTKTLERHHPRYTENTDDDY
ncbi:MAG: ribosome small subunit-dependent GTPase A [Chthoniobacterales bacterium]